MSRELRSAIFSRVAQLAQRFSGHDRVEPGSKIHADLGLDGGDFIEFVGQLEKAYEMPLEELSPHEKRLAPDVTIDTIVDTICRRMQSG